MNTFCPTEVPKFVCKAQMGIVMLFNQHEIILQNDEENYSLPTTRETSELLPEKLLYIGEISGTPCFVTNCEVNATPSKCEKMSFRESLKLLSRSELAAVLRGRQILFWEEQHKFCGACGTPTTFSTKETAKVCPQCNAIYFPRITPAVITAVFKGEQILLAHNSKFREGLYSLIAGFVEAGETLEQAVAREIYEEVGIEVKNIRYFGSQPWPFPNSLMLGFTAEYHSGLVKPDGKEISNAGWFSKDQLPTIPSKGSIAREIIDNYLAE